MIKLIPVAVAVIALLTLAGCTVTPQASAPAAPIDTPLPAAEMQTDDLITDGDPPPFDTGGWSTDFSRTRVAWDEIFSGGPPKDGIPAVDLPQYESIEAAAEWLQASDPVIVFQHNGEVRAYPQAILIWHEIVNDEVGGLPVSITFCPLCNASIAFDRRLTVNGEEFLFDFGTTGRLRNSDLIMYDRQTESWWQQFSGEAIVGRLAGAQLTFLASQVLSFEDFRRNFPGATVLARPTQGSGLARAYGRNPYTGYDSSTTPFLFRGEMDQRVQPLERVVGLVVDGQAVAYPFPVAAEMGVINDQISDTPLVIFHKSGTASALDDSTIAKGKDVGSVGVFDRRVDGQTLSFAPLGEGLFQDEQTASTWDILGRATDGPLAGTQLTQLIAFDHFWFAWAAFNGETTVYQP